MLKQDYYNHEVFTSINNISQFYNDLATGTFLWVQEGLDCILNLDTYTFSSIQATLESIHTILYNGKINDSFALLRKYFDSVIINIYTSLYIKENISLKKFIVEEINNWKNGLIQLPKTRKMVNYISNSKEVSNVTKIINADVAYKEIRDRGNDHMHYNFFKTFMYNDPDIYLPDRVKFLDILNNDLIHIFILHFGYKFTLSPHYMMSSDYGDHMSIGSTPPQGSENWVAPYIQNIFGLYIKKYKPMLAEMFITNTNMELY